MADRTRPRWEAIRPRLKQFRTLIDLGCWDGQFVQLAQASGLEAVGVDWRGDIEFLTPACRSEDMLQHHYQADIILLLSVWPYLVQQAGWTAGVAWLKRQEYRRLYFESQLFGDGPGPVEFKTQAAVRTFLRPFGRVTEVITLDVPGRAARRTVFEVQA